MKIWITHECSIPVTMIVGIAIQGLRGPLAKQIQKFLKSQRVFATNLKKLWKLDRCAHKIETVESTLLNCLLIDTNQ